MEQSECSCDTRFKTQPLGAYMFDNFLEVLITKVAKAFKLHLKFCAFIKPVVYIYQEIFDVKTNYLCKFFWSFTGGIVQDMARTSVNIYCRIIFKTFVMMKLFLRRLTDVLSSDIAMQFSNLSRTDIMFG